MNRVIRYLYFLVLSKLGLFFISNYRDKEFRANIQYLKNMMSQLFYFMVFFVVSEKDSSW